jgi:hypothetical protein
MTAKLKKDSTYKKSSNEGRQAAGKSRKPATTTKHMNKSLKNKNKPGKKI